MKQIKFKHFAVDGKARGAAEDILVVVKICINLLNLQQTKLDDDDDNVVLKKMTNFNIIQQYNVIIVINIFSCLIVIIPLRWYIANALTRQ